MAPTITPSTSTRWKIRRSASSSPSSPIAAVSRIKGIRIASAWSGVSCKFGVWNSIESRSSGMIDSRCVTSQPRCIATYVAYVESLPPENREATCTGVGGPWRRKGFGRRCQPCLRLTSDRAFANHLWPSRGFRRMRLDEMTSEEFAAIAKKDPVVILPVGALEEHGRHLPLGADVIQPLHVVDEVARRTNAYVAPAIPYGVC